MKKQLDKEINREALPPYFPTHHHPPELWEHLGRVIATFGFLENTLKRAITILVIKRKYPSWEAAEADYESQISKLSGYLNKPLVNLAETYGKTLHEYSKNKANKYAYLVGEIKQAAEIRNALCHAAWLPPNKEEECKIMSFKINKEGVFVFDTKINIAYLQKVHLHIEELICDLVESINI